MGAPETEAVISPWLCVGVPIVTYLAGVILGRAGARPAA
jgi:hypothetical protein